MFFLAVTTPLMTPVPNFNKWCAVSTFLFKNIGFCIFTPKTLLVKENYFLTLWNFTYLKDTSFGKKIVQFRTWLKNKKNEFEKWPLITFFQCTLRPHNLTHQVNNKSVFLHSSEKFETLHSYTLHAFIKLLPLTYN